MFGYVNMWANLYRIAGLWGFLQQIDLRNVIALANSLAYKGSLNVNVSESSLW